MEQVALELIRTDGGTQPRASMDMVVIAEYAESMKTGASFPPVVVFFDGSDYWLADGFHRVAAAKQIKAQSISADVRQGTRRDAVLFSVGANASHGLRRTNDDKKRAVETLLNDEEWREWPDWKIAKQCGVSREYVVRLKPSCDRSQDSGTRTVARNGTTYTMSTANIGKRPAAPTFEEHRQAAMEVEAQLLRTPEPPRKPLLQAAADGDDLTPQQARMVPKFQRLAELEEQGIYIGSVWSFGRRAAYAGNGDYHGNSIPQIVENAVLLFTQPGDLVVDPMAGSGTTVDVCEALDRRCIAFDIQPDNAKGNIRWGDARNLPFTEGEVDFVFWHPPYWNMVIYSRYDGDLSATTWEGFLEGSRKALQELYRILKPNGRMVILSGDKVQEGVFYPVSRKLADMAESVGFVDCGVAIKTTINSTSQVLKGKTIWAELAYTNNLKVEHDTISIFGKFAP